MRFVEAAKHGGRQTSVKRIVIHCTVSPCKPGGARSVAAYFASERAGGSAHYTVDPEEIVQSVRENVVAWHAPPNTSSIGIELCDPQKGSPARWSDANHEAMLRLAADLVRQVATRWKVPLDRLTVAEVKAGKRGICGHVDVSKAFGQTDHTDPGAGFPWGHFMDLVRGEEPVTVVYKDGIPVFPGRVLRVTDPMMSGVDVRTWQAKLKLRGWAITVDGIYGKQSNKVCAGYQEATNLPVTGKVDRATWDMTWSWKPPSNKPAAGVEPATPGSNER